MNAGYDLLTVSDVGNGGDALGVLLVDRDAVERGDLAVAPVHEVLGSAGNFEIGVYCEPRTPGVVSRK